MHDPEHGAEGDEEPRADCQPPGAEQLRPPDRTEEALRKRIAEADEQINRLHVTLTEARRERDAERERRIEMTRMGERGELSGWKERAEQAEAELAEARRERERWKRAAKGGRDGVVTYEYHLWMLKAVVAERRTAEQKATELAGEVERLREALERIAGLGDDQAVLDGEQTLGTAIGIARSALEDSDG
jgi:chromosome segregation ATPase